MSVKVRADQRAKAMQKSVHLALWKLISCPYDISIVRKKPDCDVKSYVGLRFACFELVLKIGYQGERRVWLWFDQYSPDLPVPLVVVEPEGVRSMAYQLYYNAKSRRSKGGPEMKRSAYLGNYQELLPDINSWRL